MTTKIFNTDLTQCNEYEAYFFGFLWADGHISKNSNSIRIEIVDSDFIDLKHIFDQVATYNIYKRTRQHWKPITSMIINNREQNRLLSSLGYNLKSFISPNTIINKIPNNMLPYFYRGISDGDGCFYTHEKQHLYQYSIGSTYEQDWSYLKSLAYNLNIKYTIQLSNKKHKSSAFRITNKHDIQIFCNYIYRNNTHIALQRKYQKSLLFYT